MSHVQKFTIFLKLSRLIVIYSNLAASLPTVDSIRTTQDSKHLKGLVIIGDGGQSDKFDTCIKSLINEMYVFNAP